MPNYRYMCDNDHVVWNFYDDYLERREAKVICPMCKEKMWWEMGANMPPPSNYPYTSDAMGVSADQVPEAAQSLLDAGIPTQFDKEGGCIVESREHRNQLLHHNGLYDRDASYGDKTPLPVEPVAPELPDEE